MRILHFDYDDLDNPYASGGQAMSTNKIFTRLSQKHQVTIVSGNYPNAKNSNKKNITIKRVGVGNLGPAISILSYWLSIPFCVWKYSKSSDVVTEYFTAPFSISLAPLFSQSTVFGIPTFFSADEMAKKYKLPFDKIQNWGVKKYNHFIALTDEVKSKLAKLNPTATITVIPGGVDDDYLQLATKEDDYVLYIGRIDIYNKGLDLLLAAWKKIVKSNKNITLIIAGNGKQEDEKLLTDLISNNKLEDNVKVVGKVVGKRKLLLYANSLFVVQPTKYESFGYVALETLAVGKLLVCFEIPGFRWIPDNLILKLKPVGVKSLYKGLDHAIRSKELRNEGKEKRRAFARNYSWDNITSQFEKTITKYA